MHGCELLSVCSQTDVGNHFLSWSLQTALTQEGFQSCNLRSVTGLGDRNICASKFIRFRAVDKDCETSGESIGESVTVVLDTACEQSALVF